MPFMASYLVHGATVNIITTVNGLLDKGLFDIIDHQVHTKRLVVDEQTDPSTLLSRDTDRVQHVNVQLFTDHGRIIDHGSQLDVGAREEGLIVLSVELEHVSLLCKFLGRLARGGESDVVLRVDDVRVDESKVDLVILIIRRIGHHLGDRGNRSSEMDRGDLLLLEGTSLGGVGGQVGVRELGQFPNSCLTFKELVVGRGGSLVVERANKVFRLDGSTLRIGLNVRVLNSAIHAGDGALPDGEAVLISGQLVDSGTDLDTKGVRADGWVADDIKGD